MPRRRLKPGSKTTKTVEPKRDMDMWPAATLTIEKGLYLHRGPGFDNIMTTNAEQFHRYMGTARRWADMTIQQGETSIDRRRLKELAAECCTSLRELVPLDSQAPAPCEKKELRLHALH
jgi:hypothetical protein